MHIAGGLYREICLRPASNGVFGSGGRAALAVAALSETPFLHSYVEDAALPALDTYRDHEIQLKLSDRDSSISFAYFHPLSSPYLEPNSVARCAPIEVNGDVVLRFGFVEGDAIVAADRAIFDPQGWRDPLEFYANGSSANELALVLNEAELRQLTATGSVDEAARDLIRGKRATIVVIKRGFRGATVVDQSLIEHVIPAFRSARVFKIGTGDVFSAVFSYYWGERKCSAALAAERASIAVAHYAASRHFTCKPLSIEASAVSGEPRGPVVVVGATDSVGSYYTFEEAIFRLRELGVEVLPYHGCNSDNHVAAVLVLAEGLTETLAERAIRIREAGVPLVALEEIKGSLPISLARVADVVDDFATAIYWVAWAASDRNTLR